MTPAVEEVQGELLFEILFDELKRGMTTTLSAANDEKPIEKRSQIMDKNHIT